MTISSTPPTLPNIDEWSFSAADLEMMTFPDVLFVLEGILPVGLSQLVAKPKMGKSFFALDLGLAVARGETFLERDVDKGAVLYFALEDNKPRLQRRTKQLSQSKPFPESLRFSTITKKLKGGLEERINQWLEQVDKPRLVIIDTLGRAMADNKPGGDEYAHATNVLGELQQLALEKNISILIIHHANKRDGVTDKFDLTLGSQGINGVMDAMFVLDRERSNRRAELYATGRDFEDVTVLMELGETGQWKVVAPNAMNELDVSLERMEVLKQIYHGVTKTGKIAAALGKQKTAISNLLKQLEVSGYVRKGKYGEYELTDIAKDTLDKAENQANLEAFDVTTHLDEDSEDSQDVAYTAPDNTGLFSDTFIETPDDVEAYLDDDVVF